jgi:hypothetical protein
MQSVKALTESTFHAGILRGRQDLDQRIYGFICRAEAFDFRNGMKDGRLVTTVVEATDPGSAPSGYILRQVSVCHAISSRFSHRP